MGKKSLVLSPKLHVLVLLAAWLAPSLPRDCAIVGPAAAATLTDVSVRSPAAGAVLPWGETRRVVWSRLQSRTRVWKTYLSLSLDGGLHWERLATLDGNPGYYDWKVHEVPGVQSRCLLQVTLLDGRRRLIARGRTGGAFTIRGVVSRYGIGAAESWYLKGFTWGKVAAGDLDGDGRTEIAALSSEGASCYFVHVLRREPDGRLPVVSTLATFGLHDLKDIAVGDVNGDGGDDIVLSSVFTAGGGMLGRLLALYQDPATGAIAATDGQQVYASDRVGDIVLGDFGGTAGRDVAGLAEPTYAGTPGAVSIFLQTPTGPLLYERRYTACPVDLAGEIHTGDVNADGRADLVVQSGARELSLILRDPAAPTPGFAAAEPLAAAPATEAPVSSFDVGDLNNDGMDDLVVASGSTLRVFPREPGGAFGTPAVIPLAFTPRKVAAIDQDGDGLTDIVVDHRTGIAVLRQTCSHTFQAPVSWTVPCQSAGAIGRGSLFQADVNGDGVPDLVVSGYNGQMSFVFGTRLP